MATQQYPTGVQPHGAGIRIRFTWDGQRLEPIWPRKATNTNLQAAARLRSEITSLAKHKQLSWGYLAQHFPQYAPDAGEIVSEVPLFSEYAQTYLDTVEVGAGTREQYRKSLKKYWNPVWANTPIDQITTLDLRTAITEVAWASQKTRNNNLIPLRGVFELAWQDEKIDRNPMDRIKNTKHQSPPVDPFDEEEADLIVAALYKKYTGRDVMYAAYFEFAFWTGMRTSEMMALTWADVDLRKGMVRVSKAMSNGNFSNRTKTARVRDVLLNDRARHALTVAKSLTFLDGGAVFSSPRTSQPWETHKGPTVEFTAIQKKLGIRYRRPYNTRHTYATNCLMAGMNVAFVANQLGNSVQVLMKTYAKWIHGEASQREMDKLKKPPKGTDQSKNPTKK